MRIYLASSWKNDTNVKQIATELRELGHEVDAFCDESTGRFVFSFSQFPAVDQHNAMTILAEESVKRAFSEDKKWIDWADCVLLILPAGKSAHLEAGYSKGAGKLLIIFQEQFPHGEFDVMYGFADLVTDNFQDVLDLLNRRNIPREFLRITKGFGWYEKKVGEEFEILRRDGFDYVVWEDEDAPNDNYNYVRHEDCETFYK